MHSLGTHLYTCVSSYTNAKIESFNYIHTVPTGYSLSLVQWMPLFLNKAVSKIKKILMLVWLFGNADSWSTKVAINRPVYFNQKHQLIYTH